MSWPMHGTGRRQFIVTTIQTQRPTLVHVACFNPDLTAFTGLLLSRRLHQDERRGIPRPPDSSSVTVATQPCLARTEK